MALGPHSDRCTMYQYSSLHALLIMCYTCELALYAWLQQLQSMIHDHAMHCYNEVQSCASYIAVTRVVQSLWPLRA